MKLDLSSAGFAGSSYAEPRRLKLTHHSSPVLHPFPSSKVLPKCSVELSAVGDAFAFLHKYIRRLTSWLEIDPNSQGVRILAAKLQLTAADSDIGASESPEDFLKRKSREHAPVVSHYIGWAGSVNKHLNRIKQNQRVAGYAQEFEQRRQPLDYTVHVKGETTPRHCRKAYLH